MNHKTRVQNRRLRLTGTPPLLHNEHVRLRKQFRAFERASRDVARSMQRMSAALSAFYPSLIRELRLARAERSS